MKLSEIKAELKKMLLQFNVVKTDKGVLVYEGDELAEGVVVKIENEDGTEEIPSGEFVTEDNKKLIVESGEIKAIEEIEITPVEVVEPEVTEEPSEEEKPEEVVEEPSEEETTEPEPSEEEVVEPEVTEEPSEEAKVADLEAKIADLEAQLAEALKTIEELVSKAEVALSKMEKMSMAKPAIVEVENAKVHKKTGNPKLDKFLAGC